MLLYLEDNTYLEGISFGAPVNAEGEVVFNTGMVGYPESLTDPSYRGQILVLTYPLIGNYGVIASKSKLQIKIQNYPYESEKIQIAGLIVSEYCKNYSHPHAKRSLADWLKSEGIPAIEEIDTRALTQKLREKGTMLGKIVHKESGIWNLESGKSQRIEDPNKKNLVAEVSCKKPTIYEPKIPNSKFQIPNSILLYDCGVKLNIIRCLLRRGCRVIRVPWNFPFSPEIKVSSFKFQVSGIVISNGPGDPQMCDKTIEQVQKLIQIPNSKFQIPILGVCLGNQILALATGAKTYKLKYGHRGQNQPVIEESGIWNLESGIKKKNTQAYITTQNHGYAVDTNTLSNEWEPWFTNLNDGTNEGLRHKEKPWMSVQFHPEACPGPTDTEWVFDEWLTLIKSNIKNQNTK